MVAGTAQLQGRCVTAAGRSPLRRIEVITERIEASRAAKGATVSGRDPQCRAVYRGQETPQLFRLGEDGSEQIWLVQNYRGNLERPRVGTSWRC
jgi:hypothetical protein